jgi:hypothetical protein
MTTPTFFEKTSPSPSRSINLHYDVIITIFLAIAKKRGDDKEHNRQRKDIIIVHGRYYCRKLH